jgi:hypothetical protein
MWESIGLLLVYLVSGYLNKRKKEQKNSDLEKQQESSEKLIEDKGFDELLINFFKDNNSSNTLEPEVLEDGELDGETYIEDHNNIEKSKDKELYKDEETLKEQIYHSKLADRKEQQLGNKWNRKEDLKKKFFKSPEMLKKAFILKEILDDPVSFKK